MSSDKPASSSHGSSLLSSWISSPSRKNKTTASQVLGIDNNHQCNNNGGCDESEDVVHRKKMAQILRYIATMHQSLGTTTGCGSNNSDDSNNNSSSSSAKRGNNNGPSFLRRSPRNIQACWQSSFFQNVPASSNNRAADGGEERWGVLFSLKDFQILFGIQADCSVALFNSAPFSFYKAAAGQSLATTTNNRKRNWGDAFRNPLASSSSSGSSNRNNSSDGKACWMRLTRLSSKSDVPEPPSLSSPAVRRYLQQWREQNADFRNCESLKDILTLESLSRAPKIAPADFSRANEIKTFLKNYKKYLRQRAFQQQLEPMYNQLFEWVQQAKPNDELVWGLGHARMITSDNNNKMIVNGPLLEVLVEVELARDGALLVRPREHTGVALNREVVSALASANNNESGIVQQRLTQLHRAVAELDPLQIAPGEAKTYVPFFQRLVMELSSGGRFQWSAKLSSTDPPPPEPNKMLITEAWCLYSRPKPSSVWARDATAFADQLLVQPHDGDNGGGLKLPRATWALTQGPSALDVAHGHLKKEEAKAESCQAGWFSRWTGGIFQNSSSLDEAMDSDEEEDGTQDPPIVFPLPASAAQHRIADLLLRQDYPAIVVEGPPGTGKTHTIVNMISAYLSQGKRVLVMSKGPSALSVIRARLPLSIRDLCVDVSLSESSGMMQLQQTVERLANRVACVCTQIEIEKCQMLCRNIEALEQERRDIDRKLAEASDRKRMLIEQPGGQRLVNGLVELIEKAPWLMKTVALWDLERTTKFRDQLAVIVAEQKDGMARVFLGCPSPPPTDLITTVAAKAGVAASSLKLATKKMLGFVPLLGSVFSSGHESALEGLLAAIAIDGRAPNCKDDWKLVLRVLRFDESIAKFHQSEVEPLIQQDGWPAEELYDHIGQQGQQRIIRTGFLETFNKILDLGKLSLTLNVSREIEYASECYELDARRSLIGTQIQSLAGNLVDAKIISELGKTFSAEAQSALIKFSQIAARARFSRASQPSNMSARQRRHRQEYLDAFDKCVRFIPCWVMTSSQISDYLPPELLFDLVVIDEASQSDINVLPGMLRASQWLIVGDGKQVSPTESFVSEDSIDALRAALPRCPLEDSLLPGQSFFDLCAQAYPRGRVVLSEHFRCAPEIINFSNQQFYDGRLVPLRLPTSKERMTPSLIDVLLPDGVKEGKVNEKECDEIVRMVAEYLLDEASAVCKTIGIISLMGDDQSRLISGRLHDRIGARKFKEHEIKIGDPPTFQGDERDIVFLSMVCSPGRVPTQNRVMHAQRMNVALSRARDRLVLVRSVCRKHITNNEDIKHAVIDFFEQATQDDDQTASRKDDDANLRLDTTTFSFRLRAETLLESLLKKRGYSVRRMGVVWNQALCVENPESSARAGLCIENAGESKEEWARVVTQQKSIERVGWKCLRVDGLTFALDHHVTFQNVLKFLESAGVEAPPSPPPPPAVDISEDGEEGTEHSEVMADGANNGEDNGDSKGVADRQVVQPNLDRVDNIIDIAAISSDDENEEENRKIAACFPDMVRSHHAEVNDEMDASNYGEIVNYGFLDVGTRRDSFVDDASSVGRAARRRAGSSRRSSASTPRDDRFDGEVIDRESVHANANEATGDERSVSSSKRRRSTYRKLDKYSRDPRFFPGQAPSSKDDQEHEWYDTDSDLAGDRDTAGEDEDYEPP